VALYYPERDPGVEVNWEKTNSTGEVMKGEATKVIYTQLQKDQAIICPSRSAKLEKPTGPNTGFEVVAGQRSCHHAHQR